MSDHNIIKPTIGRRVWYWPSYFDRGLMDHKPASVMTAGDESQPCDAGIAYVWGDRMVNLTVADQNGVMHARCSVTLVQDGDAPAPGGVGYAQWMPYQVGQAKKDAGHVAPTPDQPPIDNTHVAPGCEKFGA